VEDYTFSLTFENGSTVHGYEIIYNPSLGFNYLNFTLDESSLGNIRIDFEASESLSPIYFDYTNRSIYPNIENIEVLTSSNQELIIPSWASSNLKLMNEYLEVVINHTSSPSVFAKLIISSHAERTLGVLVPPINSITSYTNESYFLNISSTQKSVKWELKDDFPIGYCAYEIQVWWNNSFGIPLILQSERGYVYIPDMEPVLLTSESTIGGLTFDEHQEMMSTPMWDKDQDIEMVLHISDNTGMKNGKIYVQLLHYYLFAADRTVLTIQELIPSNYSDNVFTGMFDVPDEPIPLPDDEGYEIEIDYEIFVLLFFIRDPQGNIIVDSVFFTIYEPFSIDFTFLFFSGAIAIGMIVVVIYFIRRSSRNRTDPYSYGYSVSYPQTPVSLETTPDRTKFCIHCGDKIPMLASFCSHCGKKVDY